MALKTDKQQIIDVDALIYDSGINHITGDADNDLRQDVISSKANVDMITKLLHEYNANWVCKGATWVGLATPTSPSLNDAYMVLEAGTVFGVAGCQKYNILVWTSDVTPTQWVKYNVDLNDYYYTKSEVDLLISAVSPGGGGYFSQVVTGITITSSASTVVSHTLNSANIMIQIMDSNGKNYNLPITTRSSTQFTIASSSTTTLTNMKALVILVI